jgi:membrane-associated phospholipid phosphatase
MTKSVVAHTGDSDGPPGPPQPGVGRRAERFRRAVSTRALCVMGACAGLLVLVYIIAARTSTGQRFEDWVLTGVGNTDGGRVGRTATLALTSVNEIGVTAAIVVVLGVGLWRRRPVLALVGAGVVVGSVAVTELVRHIATRPILLDSGYRREDQSFPSGHTAIAMAVMCAVVLVVPYRMRGWTLLLSSVGATGIAVATVSADWHRPSDTLGSDLIVVGCAAAGVLTLAISGRVRPGERTVPARQRRDSVLPVATGTVVVLGCAVLIAALYRGAPGSGHVALVIGEAISLIGGGSVATAMYVMLRGVDLTAGDDG